MIARRALVTGAGGFVGANLVRALVSDGAEVHALVRPGGSTARLAGLAGELAVHAADLTRTEQLRNAFEAARPTAVFHLATSRDSSSGSARAATLAVNVVATGHLIEAAVHHGCRVIAAGSALEYGPGRTPLNEAAAPAPSNHYAATKAAATSLLRQRDSGLHAAVLRIFSLYGPWQQDEKLVPTAVRAALAGEPVPLVPGQPARDLLFVEDFVRACLDAEKADLPPGAVINVAAGEEHTPEQVVDEVLDLTGSGAGVRVAGRRPRPWDAERRSADTSLARSLLGWRPRHDLRSGLRATIAWAREGGPTLA